MFFRQKKSADRVYLQIVENRWEGGRSRQRVVATLGRLDQLEKDGQLDRLLASGARLSQSVMALSAHRQGKSPVVESSRIGPTLVFERLWQLLGLPQVLGRALTRRKFEFPVERAVWLTVLHRLFSSGSDRSCLKDWRADYSLPGTETLQLHQMYRAMAWLGEPLPADEQQDATPFSPRCVKDWVEEALFERRRDLFTGLELVFFDTTSIYFEGEGGEALGQYGHSKDHRPDRKQMIVGAVLDSQGRPLCCEMWPGNVTDVTTLIPVVDRLRKRFRIRSICIVADRGMISRKTIEQLQSAERQVRFILGARMRNVKEVHQEVLSRAGRYQQVHPPRQRSSDPSPLNVKEVRVEGRRYIVCLNEEQARKDRADREAILTALREQLKQGANALVGNKGYRKYLSASGLNFEIDEAKVKADARFDGKWVLQTDLDGSRAEEVALSYKQLWTVEEMFRATKTLLETRPIYHKCDETIRGHVFCSFLALMLRKELQDRLDSAGHQFEWAEMLGDLKALQLTRIDHDGKQFLLRSEARGTCGRVFQAVGVAMPSTVEQVTP
jgi:hypothetical protein